MTPADKWFNDRAGKYIDDDGAYGAQCMDLYADYQRNCLKVTVKGAAKAKDVWDSYNPQVFTKIANTPSFVPQRGDVAVWYMGTYGHIAICTGEGNTNYFVSLDQNWDSPWDGSKPSRYVRHDYGSFYGVLRPKMDVNFDAEAAAKAAADAAAAKAAADAQTEADRLAKIEAERIAAEQRKLAEEQAKLEAERLAKIKADEELAAEQIKNDSEASTEVTEPIKEETNMEQSRLKSKVMWAAVLAQALLIVGVFLPQVSDTVKVVGGALLEILTLVGILNNPTDSQKF